MNTPSFTLPGTLASARALARAVGPLLCASDDPDNPAALLAAQANYELLRGGWCPGHAGEPDKQPAHEVYFRDQASGAHGWLCWHCRRITQNG
jgi:hypothetical protein